MESRFKNVIVLAKGDRGFVEAFRKKSITELLSYKKKIQTAVADENISDFIFVKHKIQVLLKLVEDDVIGGLLAEMKAKGMENNWNMKEEEKQVQKEITKLISDLEKLHLPESSLVKTSD